MRIVVWTIWVAKWLKPYITLWVLIRSVTKVMRSLISLYAWLWREFIILIISTSHSHLLSLVSYLKLVLLNHVTNLFLLFTLQLPLGFHTSFTNSIFISIGLTFSWCVLLIIFSIFLNMWIQWLSRVLLVGWPAFMFRWFFIWLVCLFLLLVMIRVFNIEIFVLIDVIRQFVIAGDLFDSIRFMDEFIFVL